MAPIEDSHPVLLLDFDGTVCTGDEPVLAYAEETLIGVPDDRAEPVRHTLHDFLAGHLGARWEDGYAAVQDLTCSFVDDDARQQAYHRSRERLSSGELTISTPTGLVDFLADLAPDAQRVLVTNAPLRGVEQALDHLGLTPVLDRIVTGADKPDGWPVVLPQILGDRPATSAVSVGDVYRNDIAPLIPTGARTAFIDRFGSRGLPTAPTWTAATFTDLYPTLTRWFHHHSH